MDTQDSRFDYVEYDERSKDLQAMFKADFKNVEWKISNLEEGRAKALALTALEEAYMWVGKAIRDEQIASFAKNISWSKS
jgi:hypothetical protein